MSTFIDLTSGSPETNHPRASDSTPSGKENQMAGIRIVFMGTPEISAAFLRTLIESHYQVVGVVSKPDKPVGREQTVHVSPVKHLALENHIPVLTPEKLDGEFMNALSAWKPDLIIVVAYGKILPKKVLDLPGFGCLNIHASLLPRWRGASPIQNALLAGDNETGVTLMLMDEGMDTGPIIAQERIAISPDDTTEALKQKIIETGQILLKEALGPWIERTLQPMPQENTGATLCQLIERQDGQIVWSESAESIYNRYRALTPWPGIYTFLKKNDALLRFKLLEIRFHKQSPQIHRSYGEVFELGEEIGVATGEGVIILLQVQLEGKKPLPIREFLAGYPELIGTIFH